MYNIERGLYVRDREEFECQSLRVYVCVCVCVCERERERERDMRMCGKSFSFLFFGKCPEKQHLQAEEYICTVLQ